MSKVYVNYEVEGMEELPSNCAECKVIEKLFEHCPCDIYYWKAYDRVLLYAKYKKKRHPNCPLVVQ